MRKKLFTFLLALVTSVGLSYADPVGLQVTEFEVPNTWADDPTPITASDLPGFVAVSLAEAGTWNAAPTDEDVVDLIFAFGAPLEGINYTYFTNGVWHDEVMGGPMTRKSLFLLKSYGYRLFYTVGAPTNPEIKLNADFGGDWADTDAFTDNGNGKASWSISTLTAGEWYHFGVKVDGTWTSDNAAFDREHPSRVVNGTGDAMWFQADVAGEYTFTWEYATNTLTIGFPVPTVAMKGSWDNWADVVNFTDNGDGTASVTKTFEHEGYYTFKTVLDGNDWRGNGEAFKRNYTGAEGIVGNTDMTLWVDAKGEYTFTWTYASNRIDITYPALPTIYMYGEWDGWTQKAPFTNNGDGTASYHIHFSLTGNSKAFKIRVGEDDWRSNGQTFDPEHSSYAWINENNGSDMRISVDAEADYTFTWSYVENKLTISFPPSGPTVAMKGSWDEWVDEVNFTDNGDGTASVTKTFEHEGYYTFKTVLDGNDWRGNGEAFKRNYTGAEGIVGNTDMTLWVDAKGEYTFTWTYASNRIDITYPALPTVYLYLNGSTDAFTNRGNGIATYDIHFSAKGSDKEFKIRVGEDWRSNGQTFDPEHTTYAWINENNLSDMKINIDAETDYTFTWTYVENKLEITHPVVPDYTVMTKKDPENSGVYYSTFYSSNYSYKLMDDGTEAFIASISGGDLVLTMIAEGEQVIPKGTAVIFRKTGSSIPVGLRVTEENNTSFDPADNDLRGVNVATPIADKGMTQDNCYVLSGTAQYGVGFYKINDTMLKQHKAYVKYEGSSNNAPKRMRFVYGQATGIEDVQGNNVQSTKVIENGVLYIIRDGKTYNAMGQVVK